MRLMVVLPCVGRRGCGSGGRSYIEKELAFHASIYVKEEVGQITLPDLSNSKI